VQLKPLLVDEDNYFVMMHDLSPYLLIAGYHRPQFECKDWA
jgi:hypothetical protein